MKGYYCYVVSRQGRITARYDIRCETDAEAMIQAALLVPLSEDFPIEVWSGIRPVGRVPRTAPLKRTG